MIRSLFILTLTGLFSGCQLLNLNDRDGDKDQEPLARVGEKVLYPEEVSFLTRSAASKEDSTSIARRYIQSWIKKELMLKKAEETLAFDIREIDLKVRDYRYALMIFEYKKDYVARNLDTAITDEEIKAYYDSHLDNFLLKQNIIRGRFAQISKQAPKLEQFKTLFQSVDSSRKRELVDYCVQFANSYNLNDSVWINFEDVALNTPYQAIPNKIQFLESNRYAEAGDSLYQYFLFIRDYKIQDQLSPLEFVRDQVEKILINKRKVALASKLEEEVMEAAKTNNEFEIYVQ